MLRAGLPGPAVGLAAAALLTLAGCHVDTNKHGDKDNVNISTPFGGLHVRTNENNALENIGLASYPGATLVQRGSHKDAGSADVDMHFGSFQLRVKAATYRSNDPMDKVETYYRDDLKRYGDVIACHGRQPVGEPAKTMAGLTCEDGAHHRVSVDDSDGKSELQLKAGSRSHQHIVSLQPDSGGTKFVLVALDLPADSHQDD